MLLSGGGVYSAYSLSSLLSINLPRHCTVNPTHKEIYFQLFGNYFGICANPERRGGTGRSGAGRGLNQPGTRNLNKISCVLRNKYRSVKLVAEL